MSLPVWQRRLLWDALHAGPRKLTPSRPCPSRCPPHPAAPPVRYPPHPACSSRLLQDTRSLYLGLEHCPNGELYDQIRLKGRLEEAAARFYAAEVVLMLGNLRQHAVVRAQGRELEAGLSCEPGRVAWLWIAWLLLRACANIQSERACRAGGRRINLTPLALVLPVCRCTGI